MDDLRALVTAVGGTESGPTSRAATPCSTAAGRRRRWWEHSRAGSESVLGSEVPVLVRTKEELVGVIEANPFLRPGDDAASLHVTFLRRRPRSRRGDGGRRKTADDDEFRGHRSRGLPPAARTVTAGRS